MTDPRDFLAFAHYGNLGVLLLGIGLLGVLIHRRPIRQWLSAGVALLGVLLLCEGGVLFHGGMFSRRGLIAVGLVAVTTCLVMAHARPIAKP
jgi:NADH:ubiquinone oxidoreductase subunit K